MVVPCTITPRGSSARSMPLEVTTTFRSTCTEPPGIRQTPDTVIESYVPGAITPGDCRLAPEHVRLWWCESSAPAVVAPPSMVNNSAPTANIERNAAKSYLLPGLYSA